MIRKLSAYFPDVVNLMFGDALWALAVFLMIRMMAPRLRLRAASGAALALCFAVELSQLYQARWINSIRGTTLGGLVLGFGFLWSDILAYTLGVGLGTLGERLIRPIRARET